MSGGIEEGRGVVVSDLGFSARRRGAARRTEAIQPDSAGLEQERQTAQRRMHLLTGSWIEEELVPHGFLTTQRTVIEQSAGERRRVRRQPVQAATVNHTRFGRPVIVSEVLI